MTRLGASPRCVSIHTHEPTGWAGDADRVRCASPWQPSTIVLLTQDAVISVVRLRQLQRTRPTQGQQQAVETL